MADVAALIKALKDSRSPEFAKHENWYNNEMPMMLDKYAFGDNGKGAIGTQRMVGSPRDTAAEYAGAADWGQRAPADYYGALNNAKLYQALYNSGKNAQDNVTQDAAGLALGMCNPNMSKQDIVKQSVNYANQNNFGRPASFK
jgi:hypothetical protein